MNQRLVAIAIFKKNYIFSEEKNRLDVCFFFAQEISIVNEEIKDLNKALNYFMSTNTMNSFDVQKRCNQYIYH